MHKVKIFRILLLIVMIMVTILCGLKAFATEDRSFRGGGYAPKSVSTSQQKQSAFIAALVDALGSYAEWFRNIMIAEEESGGFVTRTKYQFQDGIDFYQESRIEGPILKYHVARLRIPATLLDRKDDLTILVKDFLLDSPSIDKIPIDTLISLLKRDLALVVTDVETTHTQDEGVSIELKLKKGQKIFTGLIIDAYELKDVHPCLVNRILSPTDKGEIEEVYGPKTIHEIEEICGSKIAYERMVVGYESSIERAIKNYCRVGSNPLIVKAVAADKCDIFISKDDAIKIKAANIRSKFLEKGKIIMVVQ